MNASYESYITCLAFNNSGSKQSLLLSGRSCGRLLIWGIGELEPRFNLLKPSPISCLAIRPQTVRQQSRRDSHVMVSVEHLLIGDEAGHVYLYALEWPSQEEVDLFDWKGDLTLIARLTAHTQQICGLAWSPDARFFASGANDNICYLFETSKIMEITYHNVSMELEYMTGRRELSTGTTRRSSNPTSSPTLNLPPCAARHRFLLSAAIKAIAFCPWQRGLLALGGGSNDRCIHFYHTLSGVCLATIDCAAQVTSLTWSTTRREIAATFGFAQPEHPYRIAVFTWPTCECIVKIPWADESRALHAVAYPGGPEGFVKSDQDEVEKGAERGRSKSLVGKGRHGGDGRTTEGGVWWSRTQTEGCIVVATSGADIKFHEVWAEEQRSFGVQSGLLGGSDILDCLHGIDKEGEGVIR